MDKTVETIDSTIAPKIAGIQPSTTNPGTKSVVILKTIALTMNINNPRVMIVSGKVKSTSTGLIKVLIMPKTIAAKSAEVKVSTLIPGYIM